MRILVTGHRGFIGNNLLRHLKDHEVIGIDLPMDIQTCHLPDVDAVIHLAALADVRQSIEDPKIYWEVNVEGTKRILNHYHDKRILNASSSCVNVPHLSPYGMSKFITEHIPHDNCCHMRFTTVYGEDSREGMFFEKLQSGTLEYTTKHIRDFIHVDDLCEIIIDLLDQKVVGPLDIGTGIGVRVCDIAPDLPVREGEPCEAQDNTSSIKWNNCRTVWDFLESK